MQVRLLPIASSFVVVASWCGASCRKQQVQEQANELQVAATTTCPPRGEQHRGSGDCDQGVEASPQLSLYTNATGCLLFPCFPRMEEGADKSAPQACTRVTVALEHQFPVNLTLFGASDGPRSCYPLSAAALQRSFAHRNSPRFRRLVHLVSRGAAPLRVTVLGGSVARTGSEHASTRGGSAHARFAWWLNQRYPRPGQITFTNLARDGTTTAWRVAVGLTDVLASRPDLILWDYSSNDLGTTTPRDLLPVYEQLLRKLLALPSRPAVLMVMMPRSLDPADPSPHDLQEVVHKPLAAHYGLPLVSYVDAIWPFAELPPHKDSHLFDCFIPVHPTSYVIQLVADAMAYAWTLTLHTVDTAGAAGGGQPGSGGARGRKGAGERGAGTKEGDGLDVWKNLSLHAVKGSWVDTPLPARLVTDAGAALEPCAGGWLTTYDASSAEHLDQGSEAGPPSLGAGWSFWTSRAGKYGWQFNASQSPLQLAAEKAGSSLLPKLLEPITFRMRFSARAPRLLATFLRSYALFGEAVVWFDGGLEEAERRVRVQQCYRTVCQLTYGGGRTMPHLSAEQLADACFNSTRTELGWHTTRLPATRLHMTPPCQSHLSGYLPFPFLLNGTWSDHSSQAAVQGFHGGHRIAVDPNLHGATVYVGDAAAPLLGSNGKSAGSKGFHSVHLAMIWPGSSGTPRPMFKIYGISSC